jgi:hypothetical protein
LIEGDVASAALLEFLNACEAGIAVAKRLIAEDKGVHQEEEKWDPAKIQWTKTEGTKGPYERSEDTNSPDFKTLMKQLTQHNGKLSNNGYFYWLFQNGFTVGRKKRA